MDFFLGISFISLAGWVSFWTLLTIFQFAVAIFLIIGALVVLGQLDYLKTKSFGFDQEQVLLVPLKGKLKKHLKSCGPGSRRTNGF